MRTAGRVEEGITVADDDRDLWMVLAIIQPFRLDEVTLALEALPGFGGMTVSECRGFGHGKVGGEVPVDDVDAGARIARRETELGVSDFTDKVKLEVAVASRERAQAVVAAIATAAHTGNRGDGKIFAWSVARAVRVRTFEEGARAL